MIERVVAGGQTGADIAGWRAAKAAGILTGGFMPRSFLAEDGPHPEYAGLYGAREHESAAYAPRTEANALDSDALLWFGNPYSPGGKLTLRICREVAYIPHLVIITSTDVPPDVAARWIEDFTVGTDGRLMVAGNRESKSPGIGKWVEAYLTEVFRLLTLDTPM